MEVHFFESTNIYLNLAMEQDLFMSMKPGSRSLLLWKNSPCVVMGRFQNPWLECDLEKMKKDDVLLARRQSGGGTVYHDLGNLNMSFIDWSQNYNKENNNKIIESALKQAGIKAYSSGRSDILMETDFGPKKISGAAFKQKKDRAFHHATMLLRANLAHLNSYLAPMFSQERTRTKAISSVRSKVANIGLEERDFKRGLVRSFENFHGAKADIFEWSYDKIQERLGKDRLYWERLRSWEWIYGETPLFETDISRGEWSCEISVKKGIVKSLELSHEKLHPSFLEDISTSLINVQLKREAIKQKLAAFKAFSDYSFHLKSLEEFLLDVFVWD